jgi:hypothetical protein
MHRNAVTANVSAKPLSPVVMDLESEGWLMPILSGGTGKSNNHTLS